MRLRFFETSLRKRRIEITNFFPPRVRRVAYATCPIVFRTENDYSGRSVFELTYTSRYFDDVCTLRAATVLSRRVNNNHLIIFQ